MKRRSDWRPRIQVSCQICAKPMEVTAADQRRGKGRFCSRQCAGKKSGSAARGRKRTDLNHRSIMNALRKLGVSVLDCSSVGGGVPDLICAMSGHTWLVEVKNPHTDYGRKGLNANQAQWASNWPGPVEIVRSLDDVLALVQKWRQVVSAKQGRL